MSWRNSNEISPEQLSASSLSLLLSCDETALPLVTGTPRFGCPIARVGKLIAIGLNYSNHAAQGLHESRLGSGAWLVTTDEIPNPQHFNLWLDLNGQRMQDGNTRNMIFDVAELISYASHFMTLLPGDIITTGTPAGVGLGMRPPAFLKAGDTMVLGVTGLGRQHQKVAPFRL